MACLYAVLDDKHQFYRRAKTVITVTASSGGRIDLSPKGHEQFAMRTASLISI